MVDPKQVYRVRRRKRHIDTITAAELMDSIIVEEKCRRPTHPLCFTGKWYCANENCDVRMVRVSLKIVDGSPISRPALCCPACGERMEFHGYLKEIMLLPVKRKKA
jgi:hypothetical protein